MNHLDRSRGFGQRIGFGESPAVLVIDMIVGFTNPDLPLGAEMGETLVATRQLLDVARSAGVPVFFSTVHYEDDGVWGRKIDTLGSIRLGSPEGEVDTRLGRLSSESVVIKKYPSVFFSTDFATRLVALHVDTLVITGCTTSG